MPITDSTSLTLLNQWQRGFPLVEEPFAAIGNALSMPDGEVLDRYRKLKQSGAFSRIGGVFAPGAGGASLLAAVAAPTHQRERVAAIISAQPGVNHNYEREHDINLWFVVTGRDAQDIECQLRHIEAASGLVVLRLPMLRAFRIDTAIDLQLGDGADAHHQQASGRTRTAPAPIASQDAPLAALVEQGLALCERPFDAWAQHLGCGVQDIHARIGDWTGQGVLSRFGVVVRHHEMGIRANAMTVFQVPEDRLEACGDALAHVPGVTLVYQRATADGWPYNLYCMVHGRDRFNVLETLSSAVRHAGLEAYPRRVLFSRTRYKQTGARRFASYLQTAVVEAEQHHPHSYNYKESLHAHN